MAKQLQRLNLDFEIIDAVDYQNLSEAEFNNLSDQEAVNSNPFLTKGAIACALSHVKVYQKIVDEKLEKALVLEDDAILPENIQMLLHNIENEILEDEVISLNYYSHPNKTIELSKHGAMQLNKEEQLVYPVDLKQVVSAMAYVITHDVAKKMSEKLLPISIQADHWSYHFDKGAFNSFRCLYPVVVYPAIFRSTIDYTSGKSILSKLAAFVREYRVPILLSYLVQRNDKIQQQKYISDFTEDKPFCHTFSN